MFVSVLETLLLSSELEEGLKEIMPASLNKGELSLENEFYANIILIISGIIF